MSIRVVFRTTGDPDGVFADPIPAGEARQWLTWRGRATTVIVTAGGTEVPGISIANAAEAELARWLAAETMVAVHEIRIDPGYILVRHAEGDYVSINADRIESVSAYVEDEPNEPEAEGDPDGDEEEGPGSWPISFGPPRIH